MPRKSIILGRKHLLSSMNSSQEILVNNLQFIFGFDFLEFLIGLKKNIETYTAILCHFKWFFDRIKNLDFSLKFY